MSHDHELQSMLSFGVSICEQAAEIALRYFRLPLSIRNKLEGGGFDPVTQADQEVEQFLRNELGHRYPDHGIIGEEYGKTEGPSAWQWIIDPIDGTRAFISGATAWGTLLGLMREGEPVAGVVHVPYLHETFYGSASGAWMKHGEERRMMETRPVERIEQAVLYCTHPATFTNDEDRAGFERVAARAQMVRYGGDCYSYCMLALGQLDLIIEGSLQPYDIIPIMPIVAAAGGVVTDAAGGTAKHGGVIVAAANRELHRQALELMRG